MATITTTQPTEPTSVAKPAARQPKPLPAPNSDFYELYGTLKPDELAVVKRVREFMETKVAPVITQVLGRRLVSLRVAAAQ